MTEQLSLFPEFSGADSRCEGCLARPGEAHEGCQIDVESKTWRLERQDILGRFANELSKVTKDGSKKRQSGSKPPWYKDNQHEGAIFSHLTKWKRGELVDPDSGAHPLVHLAWRALAIACKESGNVPKDNA